MPLESAFRSDIGCVRRANEDAVFAMESAGVFAVADGMGGHQSGSLASRTIVENLALLAPESGLESAGAALRAVLYEAHDRLIGLGLAKVPVSTVGATVVALATDGRGYVCYWAGDSRAYLWRSGIIEQITRDHSLVQQMVDGGILTAAEAENHPDSHIVTRALGAPGKLELDETRGTLGPGDVLLLCSDGLTRSVPIAEIAAALGEETIEHAADRLLSDALARGAPDNVSFVIVRIDG
jgi:serine/threonine protein phosphatase PrpC